jgi:hypothetical protein
MRRLSAIIGSGIAAAAVAIGVAVAAPAHASYGDEVAYLQALNGSGFVVYDSNWAINTGYILCAQFNSGWGGREVTENFYLHSSRRDVATLHIAQQWVNDAANTLCPWVWSRGVEASY